MTLNHAIRHLCRRATVCLLACMLLMIAPLGAQDAGFGTVSGTVTDQKNSVVAGATVTVTQVDTGISRDVVTTSAGTYSAAFLRPGHYELVVTAPGFAKVNRKGLTVLVGQTVDADVELPIAAAQDTVTITGDAPLIDTEKVGTSQEIGQDLVSTLPVNGRRYDNFVLLTPNVTPDGSSGLISYRGISSLYNSNLIDGANNNQAFFAEARGRATGAPYVYSSDSIQEFQSASGPYSAELGQAAGGQINAITKSGSNKIHGDLFYFLRYPDLNALDPLGKSRGVFTQPVHQQHQFGGSVGGPIKRDKLFYFFTYDGFRKVNPIIYLSSGPFTTLRTSIGAGETTYCPSPLTSSECLTAVDYLQGNLAGAGKYKLQGLFPREWKQDIFFPKLDWQFTPKNRVTAEFNIDTFHLPNGYNSASTVVNGGVTQNGSADYHERFLIANWTTVLNQSSVNQVTFQWSRDLEVAGANASGPSVSISSIAAYGMPNALPRPAFPDEHRWEVADIFSKTFGRHTLKAGFDLNLIDELAVNLFQGGRNLQLLSWNGNGSVHELGTGCVRGERR